MCAVLSLLVVSESLRPHGLKSAVNSSKKHDKVTQRTEGQNQFSSVAQLCLTVCDLMDCSTPGLPVLEFTQTHAYCGEGNGNPLQYSCLANPMDGGAW